MTTRALHPSVDAMLSLDTLGELLGRAVRSARLVERGVESSAYSGSALTSVEVECDDGPARLLLKPVSRKWDYFMRVTGDERGREALAWTSGLLDRLPPELAHAYIACARDGAGWAILMRDVGDALLSNLPPVDAATFASMLDALAAFHAAFWDDPGAGRAEDGFNDPRNYYRVISPAAAASDPDPQGVMPRIVRDGWERLPDALGRDLGATLLALANDPAPLRAALDRLPQTVVHGDVRGANLGLEHGRLLVLDWALVGREIPGLDLIWFLAGPGGDLVIPPQAAIERYRNALASRIGYGFDAAWWEPMLDLSLLGGLIRYGWIASRALASSDEARQARAEADLSWLVPGAMRGLERLGLS